MNQYMAILHGKPSEWNKHSDDTHRDLNTVNNEIVVDGPFPETKEVLTGSFIITTSSPEDAVEVSKGCPSLSHGDWVQVSDMPNRE